MPSTSGAGSLGGAVRSFEMKHNMSWEAPARPAFRIIALPVAFVCLAAGVASLGFWILECLTQRALLWTTDLKLSIPALFWGVLFLFVAIRGKGFLKEQPHTEPDGAADGSARRKSGQAGSVR
jgi:hypothetical protein